ncbi:calcium uptake protein, mitochondrial-like [Prosopis cineraria]|uniref:calcium uptake protein, mitochondrial-like n=1 Tax=Prosopis cineraria TaxID=364024 RepID=UPI00240EEC92|nr:calcium uptake protein, mitochondrial-like [Prosopis cineraria]
MFSWTSLTRFQHSLHRIPSIRPRVIFSQLQPSMSSSSSSSSPASTATTIGGFRDGDKSEFDKFLTPVSGIAVVGSALGFWYLSNSLGEDSVQAFADYAREENQLQQQYEPPKNQSFIFNDSYRRRVFFKYEKRIRLQSPLEKVFEYFASVRAPGSREAFMTPADLMRAVVPVFPPSGSSRVREGCLPGEQHPGDLSCPPSQFFMLFDTNNDGLISFPEYIFFVTLLSIPESGFQVAFKMFDLDNNGHIDKQEFNKVMALMRSQHRQGDVTGVEDGGLLQYFFGKEGKDCLNIEKFGQFLRDLHDEILRLEFSHYDYNERGSISARDFGLSLVASADINHINKLLDLVDELENNPHLRDIRVTLEEFKAFAKLRKKLQSFSLALFSYGKINGALTKTDFQRAAAQVCGVTITDNVVDIIFHVFDANRDGDLSADEFIRVIQMRQHNPSRLGCRSMMSCLFSCARNCSSAKLQF